MTLTLRRVSPKVRSQAHDILQQRPDLGVLPLQTADLRSKLATIKAGAVGPSALTAAELRLLPLLSTHLSYREIAGELFLSPHTVRSEMKSVYRKLAATTRTEAVARSRELGLLEG
jgi:LuxR family transcriptional regulator, maltose regulon positive regulatory protein